MANKYSKPSTFPNVTPATRSNISFGNNSISFMDIFNLHKQLIKTQEVATDDLQELEQLLSQVGATESVEAFGRIYPINDKKIRDEIINNYKNEIKNLSQRVEKNDPYAIRDIKKLAGKLKVDLTSGPLYNIHKNYVEIEKSKERMREYVQKLKSDNVYYEGVLNPYHESLLEFAKKGGSVSKNEHGENVFNSFIPGNFEGGINPQEVVNNLIKYIPEQEEETLPEFLKLEGFYGKVGEISKTIKQRSKESILKFLLDTEEQTGLLNYYKQMAYKIWKENDSPVNEDGEPVINYNGEAITLPLYVQKTKMDFYNKVSEDLAYRKEKINFKITDTGELSRERLDLALDKYARQVALQNQIMAMRQEKHALEMAAKELKIANLESKAGSERKEILLSKIPEAKANFSFNDYDGVRYFYKTFTSNPQLFKRLATNPNLEPELEGIKNFIFESFPELRKKFNDSKVNSKIRNLYSLDKNTHVTDNVKVLAFLRDIIHQKDGSLLFNSEDEFIYLNRDAFKNATIKNDKNETVKLEYLSKSFFDYPDEFFKSLNSAYKSKINITKTPSVILTGDQAKTYIKSFNILGNDFENQEVLSQYGLQLVDKKGEFLKNIDKDLIPENHEIYYHNGYPYITLTFKQVKPKEKKETDESRENFVYLTYKIFNPDKISQLYSLFEEHLNNDNTPEAKSVASFYSLLNLKNRIKFDEALYKIRDSKGNIIDIDSEINKFILLRPGKNIEFDLSTSNKNIKVKVSKLNSSNYNITIGPRTYKNLNVFDALNLYCILNNNISSLISRADPNLYKIITFNAGNITRK
jgi:hypothetical protein